jgi:hypothetical protein
MESDTIKWVIGGLLAVIAAGLGYFLIKLDEDIRRLNNSVHRLEVTFAKVVKRKRWKAPR